jgi:WD40 repeat protein
MVIRDVTLNAVSLHRREARLAAGLDGKVVAIWDLNSGAELIRHRLEGQPVLLELSAEGDRFATMQRATTGFVFSVHRADDGGTLASQPFRNMVTDFEWHIGGRWIAMTDVSGAVHLADAHTGALRELGRHKENASYVRFSPDGAWLVSSGWDREFICWDMRAMRRAFTMALDSFLWQFHSDGRACAVQTRTEVRLHAFEQPAGHRDFAEDLGGHASRAAFSPDGRWLAASGMRQLAVWDLQVNGPAALAEEAGDTHLAFSATGELFAARRGAAFRWKVAPATNESLPPRLTRLPFAAPGDVIYLALATNGVVLTSQRGSRLVGFDQLKSGGQPWVRTADGPNGLSADGRWLGVFRSYTPHLYVYQMPEMTRVAKLTQAGNIANFQFSPAGDELAVCTRAGVEFWSTADWRRTRARTNFTDFRQFFHAPDGRTCWMATDHRSGGLYRTDTLEPLLPLPHGMAPLAISPDGRQFAVSVDEQRLRVWNLAEVRRQLRELGMDWAP